MDITLKSIEQLLDTKLEPIKKDINSVKNDIEYLKNDVTSVKNDVEYLKNNVTSVKNDIESVKKDISIVKTDVRHVERVFIGKLESVKNDISAIRTDLHATKVHVESINNRLFKMENRMINVELKVDQANKKSDLILRSYLATAI